jgi:HEAT repeat protein
MSRLEGEAAAITQVGLKSGQPEVERSAIYAAALFGFPFVENFIPSLQTLLGSSDPSVVRAALGTLGSFGPVALPAVPAIEPLIGKNADRVLQVHARVAIARIQGAQDRNVLRQTLNFLDSALSSDDPAVRASTVHGLGQLGRMARPSVAALLGYLRRPLSEIERLQVAISLLRIGTPTAQRVAERIIAKSRESSDPAVRATLQSITAPAPSTQDEAGGK